MLQIKGFSWLNTFRASGGITLLLTWVTDTLIYIMSEIVENLEKTLLSINVEQDYSKEDIDCIVDGMKNLVKIVKFIHTRSSDTKRLMSQTRKKLDEAEIYIKHLENRLHMLESADRSTAGVDVTDITGDHSHDSHEECRLDPIL